MSGVVTHLREDLTQVRDVVQYLRGGVTHLRSAVNRVSDVKKHLRNAAPQVRDEIPHPREDVFETLLIEL